MNSKQFIAWVWLVLAVVLFAACGNDDKAGQPLPAVPSVAGLENSNSTSVVAAETSLPVNETAATNSTFVFTY